MADNKYENIEGTASWLITQRFTDDKKRIFKDIHAWHHDNYLKTVEKLRSYDISEGDYVNVCAYMNKTINYKGIIKPTHADGILLQQKRRDFFISCIKIDDIQIIKKNATKNVVYINDYRDEKFLH